MTEEHLSRDPAAGEDPPETGAAPAEPRPGSRAAKLARLKREHPRLYASRHVAIAALEVTVGLLGLKALLTAFLPQIDLSWIPLPDINLPDIDLPPWLDPLGWLVSQIPWPDITLPGWVLAAVQSGKAWAPVAVPLVVAVLVALAEVEKRKRRQRASATTTAAGKSERSEEPEQSEESERQS